MITAGREILSLPARNQLHCKICQTKYILIAQNAVYDIDENGESQGRTVENTVAFKESYTGRMLNKFNYSINYDSSDRPVSYTLNNIDKKSSYSGSASYDSKDRVTSIQRGSMTFNYTYDCDGRIIREDNENQNYTLRFKYDKKGNVAKREELKHTDSGKPDEEIDFYEITELNYSDDDLWLESIEILCDEEELSLTVDTDVNGNTINYKMNNYNLLEYEWTNGRQLSAVYYADEETGESVCVARMTYDESGMRTSKTTEGVTTYYTYQGDKLLSQYQQDENE